MTNHITTTLNGKRIALIPVPSDATDIHTDDLGCLLVYNNPEKTAVSLLGSGWRFIGLSNEMTEEQCKSIVKKPKPPQSIGNGGKVFKGHYDYVKNEYVFGFSATQSFTSLMHSLGLFHENPLGPVKPVTKKPFPYRMTKFGMNKLNEKWQAAQERIGVWAVCMDKEGEG
jgi:hypothetical protein